jgi:hypothetical protein
MLGGTILIGVALVVLLVGFLFWYQYHTERKRSDAMAVACQLMNFAFTEKTSKEQMKALSAFDLLQRGHSRRARNLMAGVVSTADVELFDYQYTIGSGKSSHTSRQTVLVLADDAARLPNFQLVPENFLHKIGQLFGYQDIDFAEDTTFSRQYLLRGRDEQAIRQTFTAEALAYFAAHPGWSVEAKDGRLAVFQAGKRRDPDKCPEFVAEAMTILRLFQAPDVPEEIAPPGQEM